MVQAGDAMTALMPGGELVTIPAGHCVHAEQPAAFISAVTTFFSVSAQAGESRG